MRETPAPHSPQNDSAADVLALWRCDEAGATALVDTRAAFTTTLGTLPTVTGGLFLAPAGASGARTFNGSTQFATAPGSTGAASVFVLSGLGQGYSISAWIRPTVVNVEQVILSYGGTGTGEVLSGNTLTSLRLNASAKLRMFWEHGAGVDTVIDCANMAALVAGVTHHVEVVVWRGAANISVEFWLDGVLIETDTTGNANGAAGGTNSPVFAIGRHSDTLELNGFWSGDIDDIRVTKVPASAAFVRDSYARGARNFDYTTMYASGAWESHVWVYAQYANAAAADFDRGIGYLDVSNIFGHDHLLGADYGEDVDHAGADAAVRLRRQVFKQNLGLGWNFAALNDANFLGLMQRVKIEVADVPLGYGRAAAAIHRQPVFEGVITGHQWSKPTLELKLTDRIRGLQIAWCKPVDDGTGIMVEQQFCTAGDRTMEQVVQDYLTAFLPTAGYKPNDDEITGAVTAYVPGAASGFNVEQHGVLPTQSVSQAIEVLVNQIAARARYRWDDFRKAYRFTVYEVNRAAASTLNIDNATALEWTDLAMNDEDIRNNIDVDHMEAATTQNTGEYTRFMANSQDATSITKYGERYASIGIGSARNIKDATTAQKLADNVKADLKDPKAVGTLEILHRFVFDVEDVVTILADTERFAANQALAVTGYRGALEKDKRRTTLTMRNDKPIAGHARHFDHHVTAKGHRAGRGRRPPGIPVTPSLTAIAEGLRIDWTMPVGKGNRKYKSTEVHASTTTGFTPGPSTLQKLEYGLSTVLKGLSPASAWFIKLVHRDDLSNTTTASAQATTTPRYLPKIPSCWATLNADYNPGAGKSLAHFDFPVVDDFGVFNLTTFTFTATAQGLYSFEAAAHVTDTANFTLHLDLECTRSGGGIFQTLLGNVTTSALTGTSRASGVVFLRAGDTVKAQITTSASTANMRVKSGVGSSDLETYFTGAYLGIQS